MGSETARFRSIPPLVLICALFVLVASILGSVFIFHRSPHINDEFGYLFQAKLFASGHLYAPSPCAKEAFDFPHIINNGRWYSQYPPGFPLLLVPWVVAGDPWLINPLFAALSVVVFYLLGLELFGRREGLLAAALGAFSIWLIVMSATMMSHTTNMFFFALFMLFIIKSVRTPSFSNGAAAGASFGMAVLIRPYETILAGLPFFVFYGIALLKSFRPRLKNAAGLVVFLGLFAAAFLLYNQLTNGNPFLTGHIVRYGPEHGIGFGKTGYTGIPHTPDKGLMLLAENYKAINDFLFGWPLSSLIFLFPLVLRPIRRSDRGTVLLLLASFLSLSIGLTPYWGTSVQFGARMFFVAVPDLVLLTAAGMVLCSDLLLSLPSRMSRRVNLKAAAAGLLTILVLYAFLIRLPGEVGPRAGGRLIGWVPAESSRSFSKAIRQKDLIEGNALVIVKPLAQQRLAFRAGGWGVAFVQNDPFLEGRLIFANDVGLKDGALFDCFPERALYLYWGTWKRALLIPLRKEAQVVTFGSPIIPETGGRREAVDFVGSPEEVFTLYSEPFKESLRLFLSSRNLLEIDAAALADESRRLRRDRDYRSAAFLLEAALQLETVPEFRYQLLGELAALYTRLGDGRGAARILNRLNSKRAMDVNRVIPEKGF
jgi:4-amino-4-deoxy-L-arabinose transferase-like glycosyltransferase